MKKIDVQEKKFKVGDSIPTELEDTLKDIFEIRLIVEIGMADFIFQHITQLYKIISLTS